MDAAPRSVEAPPKLRHCYRCEYDLTGLPVDVCPECGMDVRPETAAAWEQNQRRTRRMLFWGAPVFQLPVLIASQLFGGGGILLAAVCMLLSAACAVSFGIKEFKRAKARWVLIPGVGLGLLLWAWWILVIAVTTIFAAAIVHS